jgi:Na+/glutamate symporter
MALLDTWGEFVANQPAAAGFVAAVAGGTMGIVLGTIAGEVVTEVRCRKVKKAFKNYNEAMASITPAAETAAK